MSSLKIAIVDYKLSNLFSVAHACEFAGLNAKITSDPEDVQKADAIILPGVGAFADAMKNLNSFGLTEAIIKHINQKKPFMGVCLGLQLLFEKSQEFGNHKGLGVLKGKVAKLPEKNKSGKPIRIPHIGWDKIKIINGERYFSGIDSGDFMYFVHSYFVIPDDRDIIATTTNYEEIEFVSGVCKDNIFAVQFHPEKSGPKGPLIYRNFVKSALEENL